MKKLNKMEIAEIMTNHEKSAEKTLETTIYKAYNRGQIDGLKSYFKMKLEDLEQSFIKRESFDDAIVDIQDIQLLDETDKEKLQSWISERLDGKKLNKEDFMKVLNDELNHEIIRMAQQSQKSDFKEFLKNDEIVEA